MIMCKHVSVKYKLTENYRRTLLNSLCAKFIRQTYCIQLQHEMLAPMFLLVVTACTIQDLSFVCFSEVIFTEVECGRRM
jgi:hypothetical protein